jgi:hypothetical protein
VLGSSIAQASHPACESKRSATRREPRVPLGDLRVDLLYDARPVELELPELGPEKHQHVCLRRRRHRRASPFSRDDRHLAEEVARPECLEQLVAVLDVHRSVLDHEEAVPRRAFHGQPGPRGHVAPLEHAGDLAELVRGELGEEWDRADAVDLDGHTRAIVFQSGRCPCSER